MTGAPDPGSAEVLYGGMRWNTPLSEPHARLLLERFRPSPDGEVVDLGCGWGELLLRALEATPGARGVGVDSDEWVVARARASALERGLEQRVTFVAEDATSWRNPAGRVICIGASHAWGGHTAALSKLVGVVEPGGRLLFGDGFWEKPPTAGAAQLFGEGVPSLMELVQCAIDTGWQVLHLDAADQQEWDDFESGWAAGRRQWLLANPEHPEAAEVERDLNARLREYIEVYRTALGFAYLVLAR